MGILVKNSDFELLWGEEYPSIAFDNTSYSLAGEVGTTLSASFAVFDNNDEDVTDQCEITLSNDNVSIENGMFICDDLEVGEYTTEVTATYSYLSATVTATATINISVEEEKATSIAFSESSYSMNGSEYGALSTQFSVEDNLGNDITTLCAYSFLPNDKGLYAEGGYFKVDSATAGIYSITVTATYGELTNTATIAMAVVDYPDSISFDSNSYSMSGTEGDTITQSFTVTDDLSHDVTANCVITFSPNNTGLTASNGAFDASAVAEGTYSVTATATYQSGNGRTLTATATISMEIASASFDNKYLTFEALESGTFTLNVPASVDSTYMTSVSYSTDNGSTWVDTTIDATAQTITTPTIAQGGKVLWKGVGKQMSSSYTANSASVFSSTGNFNVSGNIMSLLYGDNFQNQTSFPNNSENTFSYLLKTCKVISAENLVLPATTMTSACYQYMFNGCTSLTTAPQLPATTAAGGCYTSMFDGCSSLTTATTTLPATTLYRASYSSMFRGCRALTTAPSIAATTLADYCCNQMFSGCTSITTSPILRATNLNGTQCYAQMFSGCTNLNNITMLATSITSGNALNNWVSAVAATGTFTKAASMTTLPEGASGIPSGWTVVDYSE